MATVEKARLEMFEDVCDLFLDQVPAAQRSETAARFYKPIFSYSWDRQEDHCGYVLLDQGKVVGFIGAYFSSRVLNGSEINCCNLSAWKVHQDYRTESMMLLFPFLRMKHHVLSAMTVAKFVYPIYKKLGFQDLETHVRIIPAILSNMWNKESNIAVSEVAQDDTVLKENDRKIYRDHSAYQCIHLVAHTVDAYCYVIVSRTRKRGMNGLFVHYVSNPGFFCLYQKDLGRYVSTHFGALYFCIDERYLKGQRPPLSLRYKLGVPRIYKGEHIPQEHIDSLYGELVAADVFAENFY